MASCFNSHFSFTPNWNKVFQTNTSGQQNFCGSVFLEEIFTNSTNALAGKGLRTSLNHHLQPIYILQALNMGTRTSHLGQEVG